MASSNIFEQNKNNRLLHQFCEYTKNALEECLRNVEEGKTLDYISYCFELILLTVMQIEYTNIGSLNLLQLLGSC